MAVYCQLNTASKQCFYPNIVVRYCVQDSSHASRVHFYVPVPQEVNSSSPHFGGTSRDISEELDASTVSWHLNEAVKSAKGTSLKTRNTIYIAHFRDQMCSFIPNNTTK